MKVRYRKNKIRIYSGDRLVFPDGTEIVIGRKPELYLSAYFGREPELKVV